MNRWTLLSIICFFISIFFLLLAAVTGELSVGLLLIFPIIIGSGLYAFIGFLLIFLCFIFFYMGKMHSIMLFDKGCKNETPHTQKNIQTGGVILIGPIPIVFGSHWKITLLFGIIGILLLLLTIYMFSIQ